MVLELLGKFILTNLFGQLKAILATISNKFLFIWMSLTMLDIGNLMSRSNRHKYMLAAIELIMVLESCVKPRLGSQTGSPSLVWQKIQKPLTQELEE